MPKEAPTDTYSSSDSPADISSAPGEGGQPPGPEIGPGRKKTSPDHYTKTGETMLCGAQKKVSSFPETDGAEPFLLSTQARITDGGGGRDLAVATEHADACACPCSP